MTDSGKPTMKGPIPGYVVGQYFGIFNGIPADRFQHIVNSAPFDACNLLILAFVSTVMGNDGNYVARLTNHRDHPEWPAKPGDMDADRINCVVGKARAMNPHIKILISLAVGANDAGNAAKTPEVFADSVASIVHNFGLDGFDIDFEPPTDVTAPAMLRLAQELQRALRNVTPKREMIMTICPAQTDGLDKSVLEAFTYTMPQSYDHGGNGTTVDWYKDQLGSFDRIVYGLNSEGYVEDSDDPSKFVAEAQSNHAAGVFAWRLDNDSLDRQTNYPTFATGKKMWQMMNSVVG